MRFQRGLTRLGLIVAACASALVAIDGWSVVATAKRADAARQREVSAAQLDLDVLRKRNDAATQQRIESVYSTIGARVRSIYDNNTKTLTDADVGRKTAALWLQLPEAIQDMVLSGARPDDQDQFFEFLAQLRGEENGRQITLPESLGRLTLFQQALVRSEGNEIFADTRKSFRHLGELYPVDDPESRARFMQEEIRSAELSLFLAEAGGIIVDVDGQRYYGPDLAEASKSFVLWTVGTFLVVAGIWFGVVLASSWVISGFRG